MNTLEFLRATLPEDGYKFVALGRVGRKGIAHKAYESLEVMAEAIDSYDRQSDLTVYHACAAYKAPSYEGVDKDGNPKTKYRGAPNWLKVKAYWCDIDCGEDKAEEGKGYQTKAEAAKAIRTFCATHKFPAPMIVDSGGGLHCYWPLTRSIEPDEWRRVATGFKAMLKADGVLADPTRTADLSSVLRPVGTTNRKPGREEREVKLKLAPTPIDPEQFAAAVKAVVQDDEPEFEIPEYLKNAVSSDELVGYSGPQLETSAHEIANHCAQVAKMRDTQGDVSYEHWRGVIGLIRSCVEGYDLAVEWSERRAETGHSNLDTDVKYESWSAGATTCEHFRTYNPSGCEGCPHNGKIHTPMVLGRIIPEPAEQIVEVQTDSQTVQTTVPPLPNGFEFNNGRMIRLIKDKDGVLQPYTFCLSLFYPIQRIRKPDGTFAFTLRMHLPDHRVRDFEVDTASLASSTDLLKALSRYELLPTNNKDASMHLSAYIRDSVYKLMHEQREVDTLTSFGWRDNMSSFLIGDRLYHKDGTVRRVFVGGAAADKQKALPEPRGTLAAYSKAVNFIYSRPHSEAAQYVFCNTYGSMLSPFGEDSYNGLLLCVVGDGGLGKTTVSFAARYGLGDAFEMKISGRSGATINATWKELGTYNNISLLFDEMTDIDAAVLSSMAYTISQGADKSRLTSQGGKVGFAERQTWAQSPEFTANEDMLSKLAQHNNNTQAEAMRMVQVNFMRYGVVKIDPPTLVSQAVSEMRDNWGNAGDVFIRYVVTHQAEVKALIQAIERRLTERLTQSEYRFYRNHAACTLAAARILIDLGVVTFDYEALEHFAFRLLTDLVNAVMTGNVTTPADALSRMLRDFSSRIIVTTAYRDLRTDSRGPEESLSRIQGVPIGRRVLGIASPNSPEKVDPKFQGRLFLAKKEFNDWCAKNRMEPKALLDYADLAGWLVPWAEKFNLGRGTAISTGSCSCYVFDYSAMEGAVEKTSGPALVDLTQEAVSLNG